MSDEKKHRETIFDHNPTERELKRWGGREAFEYFESHGIDPHSDQDTNLYRIGMLYAGRGDYEKANEYWAKMEDKSLLCTLVQDF